MAGWELGQRKGTRHLCGARPAGPREARRVGWREFILGQSATKLLVPSAFFSSETILSRNEPQASETLGKSVHC